MPADLRRRSLCKMCMFWFITFRIHRILSEKWRVVTARVNTECTTTISSCTSDTLPLNVGPLHVDTSVHVTTVAVEMQYVLHILSACL